MHGSTWTEAPFSVLLRSREENPSKQSKETKAETPKQKIGLPKLFRNLIYVTIIGEPYEYVYIYTHTVVMATYIKFLESSPVNLPPLESWQRTSRRGSAERGTQSWRMLQAYLIPATWHLRPLLRVNPQVPILGVQGNHKGLRSQAASWALFRRSTQTRDFGGLDHAATKNPLRTTLPIGIILRLYMETTVMGCVGFRV